MNQPLYELESKRREFEKLSSSAESQDEAIERGWAQDTEENRNLIARQRAEYRKLSGEILSLKKSCGRENSSLFDELIVWHLKTALQMYEEYSRSKEDMGVQIICLGSLIAKLGSFVGPSSSIFTVNTFHLKAYYDYLEENKPQ